MMTTREVIDGLEMLRFFNQRAGRELWGDKPKQIQDKDIEHADRILCSAISALEKQIPKKPKRVGYFLVCPICYGRNGLFDDNYVVTKQRGHDENISHCLVCGQAIDWTEGEG